MAWTRFFDMSSGGYEKLKWPIIYIEAPEAEAEAVFRNRFGRDPHNVTCECCGADYSVREWPGPEFEDGALVICADDIQPAERSDV